MFNPYNFLGSLHSPQGERTGGGSRFKVQGARANGTIVLQLLELPETP